MADNASSYAVSEDEDEIDVPETAVKKKAANKNDVSQGDVAGIGAQRLQSFIDRIERLEEEKAALTEDLKEIYAEAKGVGFDVKTIRKIISLRKVDEQKRKESDELLELYKSALGMV